MFISLLFITAFDVGFVRTATHPGTVKRLVAESGIYDTVVTSLLQQAKSINTDVGTISASDPTIQKAANQTITPQYIKQNAEMTIDSIYVWLDGKTTQPDFRIDLAKVKNDFAGNFSATVEQKLATLPACTNAESSVIAASGQYDAINASCLPHGVTAADAAAKLKASIAGNGDFLEKTTLSADNLKGDNNQPVFSGKLKDAPKQYQRAKKTPLILIILTVLCGVGIVFLSTTWQKGLRHISINLVVIGAVMLIIAFVLNKTVSSQIVPKIKLDNAVLQTDVRNLVRDLSQQIDKNYWFFGGIYSVLGVIGVAAAEVLHRKSQPLKEAKSNGASETEAPDKPKPQK